MPVFQHRIVIIDSSAVFCATMSAIMSYNRPYTVRTVEAILDWYWIDYIAALVC